MKITKIKFSASGKKNVHLFGVMTKTSVLSDKNVPLSRKGEELGSIVINYSGSEAIRTRGAIV